MGYFNASRTAVRMKIYIIFRGWIPLALLLICFFFYFTSYENFWVGVSVFILYMYFVQIFSPRSNDRNHNLEDSDAVVVTLYKEGKLR